MICSFMPNPASTELTEFSYISYRKKNYRIPISAPYLLTPGSICSLPLPVATGFDRLRLLKIIDFCLNRKSIMISNKSDGDQISNTVFD